MTFLDKLDYLMQKYDLNKNTLSQASGVPYTTIDSFYKKGYENAKLSTIQKLACYFNTTLDYLMRDEIEDPNYGKSTGFEVNFSEMQYIKKYRNLDSHGKEMVDFVLETEYKRSKSEQENSNIIPMAAHNDFSDEEEQQALMQKDLDEL